MTILPPNATPLESALESALDKRQLPVEIGKLWNPQTCPEALLPWLAWSLSVDSWDPAWNTQTKRQAIANSAKVHRQKGTVGAVKAALDTMGVSIDFIEWFDDVEDLSLVAIQDTRPHHFAFIAWAGADAYTSNEVILSPELYKTIKQITERTKPLRSHFDFLVGTKLSHTLIAGTSASAYMLKRSPTQTLAVQPPDTETKAQISAVSAGWHQINRTSQQTLPVQIPTNQSSLTTAMNISKKGLAVARFYMQ